MEQQSQQAESTGAPLGQNFTSLAEALKVVHEVYNHLSATFDLKVYKLACEYVVDHLDELKERVYLRIPRTNDGAWDRVKKASLSRCGCGADWVIMPKVTRTEFEAGTQGEVVLVDGKVACLKPTGAHDRAAYTALMVDRNVLTFWNEPLAPASHESLFDMILGPVQDTAYLLSDLANALPLEPEPPVFMSGKPNGVPLCVIKSADPVNRTVTIVLDKDVEVIYPPTGPLPENKH